MPEFSVAIVTRTYLSRL